MKRTLTNLLRSASVAVCCVCGLAAFAQSEVTSVIASGGTSTDVSSCTIGQPFFSPEAGMWVNATGTPTTAVSTGIDGIYADGDVTVENVAGDQALNIKLTDQMIADGASYSVYSVSGMLLESDKITSNPFVLKYDHLLGGKVIIVAIQTSNGIVATYKLSK